MFLLPVFPFNHGVLFVADECLLLMNVILDAHS